MKGKLNTHHCGELTEKEIGKEVILCGWVHKYRNLGGLNFIDLRDKYGITQLNFQKFTGDIAILKQASLESVVYAKGKVSPRPKDAQNKNRSTGMIEIEVSSFQILSQADKDTLPFLPFDPREVTEDLRLKHRYLDLRTDRLQRIITLRSQTLARMRKVLSQENFVEVETPILYRSTPEGARDYIVPSRIHPHKVYALPQSPQILKQLLMIGGTDKYFQIARCFRDEDLRADRQPEFSQLDIEVSFASSRYVKELAQHILTAVFDLPSDFTLPVLSYNDALKFYGTDKPDIRFDLKHMDVTETMKNCGFPVFNDIVKKKGTIKAIFLPKETGSLSRKKLDQINESVKSHNPKGFFWFKYENNQKSGGIAKFISQPIQDALLSFLDKGSKHDGIWLFAAHEKPMTTHACADVLRRHLGKKFNLYQHNKYSFLWIDQFPLLQWDEEEKRYYSLHHPFTMPMDSSMNSFMNGELKEMVNCR
ncbi:MAG: aspartate--tRNA ligase, partial [Halobacteriovoraceae bacterium]|nr:aspartate--tRNA ligase [Halobacteriovoraceae bacterium]